MFSFGKKSAQELSEGHDALQKIYNLAISRSMVDFSIVEVGRTVELQREYFKQGKSTLNPDNPAHFKHAMHLRTPSEAVDICVYVPGKPELAYCKLHLCFVSGVLWSCAKELFEKGEIDYVLRWGGNWDGDGEIIHDQKFDDLPHMELQKRR